MDRKEKIIRRVKEVNNEMHSLTDKEWVERYVNKKFWDVYYELIQTELEEAIKAERERIIKEIKKYKKQKQRYSGNPSDCECITCKRTDKIIKIINQPNR